MVRNLFIENQKAVMKYFCVFHIQSRVLGVKFIYVRIAQLCFFVCVDGDGYFIIFLAE